MQSKEMNSQSRSRIFVISRSKATSYPYDSCDHVSCSLYGKRALPLAVVYPISFISLPKPRSTAEFIQTPRKSLARILTIAYCLILPSSISMAEIGNTYRHVRDITKRFLIDSRVVK